MNPSGYPCESMRLSTIRALGQFLGLLNFEAQFEGKHLGRNFVPL